MKAFLIVLVAVVALAAAAKPKWHQLSHHYTFEQYKEDFGKAYHPRENRMRRAIFEETLATILAHNSQKDVSYRMGVNHMTDWTLEERKSLLGYHKGLGQMQHVQRNEKYESGELQRPAVQDAPFSVDWRGKGVLTAVKDQGQCGSCWSFASAESVESMYALATGELPVLSEQHILSCTPNPQHCGGNGGCEGGTTEIAFSALQSTGLASEWKYPYLSWYGNNSKCRWTQEKVGSVVSVTGYVPLPSNDQDSLVSAVAYQGPIAISVDASNWHLYESGIFDDCNQVNPDIDHAVQLVGYGYDQNLDMKYWTVRNSWTPDFGEQGFIRLFKEDTPRCGVDLTPLDGTGCDGGPANVTVCGTCGLLYDSTYPLIQV
mmetsp:Transcript_18341/g.25371  ORF Transcript_18341/g.25371 Transcript_18341/m.25371 type:complete len:374 (-) Transcript_18341:140-1261(-)|eukprot:CAMPEP_0201484050 /NCGR_PEP_ID=MMETSP0151_2-20130828/8234_1 /ASSEMBLY_ACC=CAM_ASM_000257 /TAXON_ID=200890 /ORGANISM="Paramoeba atlantica, Strain 621/1 / CCAP 1560/9" /LENGTH=373 /DNA_ID=CAMNT_0047867503 /DNA_START=609 /DNA_END=1730 /DNA_ORIENTATION=-